MLGFCSFSKWWTNRLWTREKESSTKRIWSYSKRMAERRSAVLPVSCYYSCDWSTTMWRHIYFVDFRHNITVKKEDQFYDSKLLKRLQSSPDSPPSSPSYPRFRAIACTWRNSVYRLLDCKRSRPVELSNSMGGNYLTFTVHLLVCFLLYVYSTYSKNLAYQSNTRTIGFSAYLSVYDLFNKRKAERSKMLNPHHVKCKTCSISV